MPKHKRRLILFKSQQVNCWVSTNDFVMFNFTQFFLDWIEVYFIILNGSERKKKRINIYFTKGKYQGFVSITNSNAFHLYKNSIRI